MYIHVYTYIHTVYMHNYYNIIYVHVFKISPSCVYIRTYIYIYIYMYMIYNVHAYTRIRTSTYIIMYKYLSLTGETGGLVCRCGGYGLLSVITSALRLVDQTMETQLS